MKFLALKQALEKALPPPQQPCLPEGSSNLSSVTTSSSVVYPFSSQISKGVNDGISRDPVDLTARLVTAKAPWWAKPPPEPKKPLQPRKKIRMSNNKINERDPIASASSKPGLVKSMMGPNGEELYNLHEIAHLCVEEIKKDIPKGLRELAISAKECREMLDTSTSHAGGVMEEFRKTSADLMALLRDTRFSTVNETRQIMSQLRDVREFFLGDKHEEQIRRLSEFVDLCERLKKLHDSGFLNAVADTIIKLS